MNRTPALRIDAPGDDGRPACSRVSPRGDIALTDFRGTCVRTVSQIESDFGLPHAITSGRDLMMLKPGTLTVGTNVLGTEARANSGTRPGSPFSHGTNPRRASILKP